MRLSNTRDPTYPNKENIIMAKKKARKTTRKAAKKSTARKSHKRTARRSKKRTAARK
jgi:hypothetical protein